MIESKVNVRCFVCRKNFKLDKEVLKGKGPGNIKHVFKTAYDSDEKDEAIINTTVTGNVDICKKCAILLIKRFAEGL